MRPAKPLEVFNASYVAMSYLRAAAFASICGALAACMFWIAKHRGVREASKTIV